MDNLLISYIEPPPNTHSVGMRDDSIFKLGNIHFIHLSNLHRYARDVIKKTDILVIKDICDPDLIPLIRERKKVNKLTVYELSDLAISRQSLHALNDRHEIIKNHYLLKLLLYHCDVIKFSTVDLQEIYGHLNSHSTVIGDQERDEPIAEFYRSFLKFRNISITENDKDTNIFQELSSTEGAQVLEHHLFLRPTRFEELLHNGLILKKDTKKKKAALACFEEAINLFPQNFLPFLLGASIMPDPIEALNKALNLNPQSISAWILLAEEYIRLQNWNASLQALEFAANIAPYCDIPYLKAAKIMKILNRQDEWLTLIDKAQSSVSALSKTSSKLDDHTSPRKTSSYPKRAFLLASKKSILHDDCAGGLEELGWEVKSELFGSNSHNEPDALEKLALKIRTYNPHLVFSINQAGCDAKGYIFSALFQAGIPAVIWYVDNPFALLPEDGGRMVQHAAVLACFDSSYVADLQNRTNITSIHLPLGTNSKRFNSHISDDLELKWNISFVGNLDLDMVSRQRTALETDHAHLVALVDKIVKNLMSGKSSRTSSELLKDIAPLFSIDWHALPHTLKERICIVAETDASAKKRAEIISMLSDEKIKVIGGPEWQPFLRPEQLSPPVNYLSELCPVYQKSRINLNISKFQLRSGVNQRIFDVPAAGGFVLTDQTSDLEQYFRPDEEVAVYGNAQEIKSKVKYYLNHEHERLSIIDKARIRVLNEHTYKHRMTQLINFLGVT